jgi:uncharacterized protein (TIGR03546 family)
VYKEIKGAFFLLKAIAKLVKALNGNVKRSQIASGIAWGFLLGFVPAGNFFWVALFLVSFFFRHNHASKIFAMAVLKLLYPLLVLWIDGVGWDVLNTNALYPLFTALYNMPFVPLTNFNNTLVMGGLVCGILLWIPSYLVFIALIPLYRNHLSPKIRNSKFVKALTNFPFYKLIEKAFLED